MLALVVPRPEEHRVFKSRPTERDKGGAAAVSPPHHGETSAPPAVRGKNSNDVVELHMNQWLCKAAVFYLLSLGFVILMQRGGIYCQQGQDDRNTINVLINT